MLSTVRPKGQGHAEEFGAEIDWAVSENLGRKYGAAASTEHQDERTQRFGPKPGRE